MKVRLTILTENDAKVPDGITEDVIQKAWQDVSGFFRSQLRILVRYH